MNATVTELDLFRAPHRPGAGGGHIVRRSRLGPIHYRTRPASGGGAHPHLLRGREVHGLGGRLGAGQYPVAVGGASPVAGFHAGPDSLADRWRAIYGFVATALLTAAVVLALVGIANLGSAGAPGASGPAAVAYVRQGESLSELAARILPWQPVAVAVRRIIDMNDLPGTAVQAGQALLVPVLVPRK